MKQPVCRKDQEFYRLIPSRFPPVDVYERLRAPELRATAKALEEDTNPRLAAKKRAVGGDHSMESSPQYQNWNHAPFAYKSPYGSFLLSRVHGVLEASEDRISALAFAVLRREEFLGATGEAPISLDMRMLVTKITGRFADLTNLDLDIQESDRWKIGQSLLDENQQGAIFRRPGFGEAKFIAVFDNEVLGPSTQAEHYRFVWDGKKITKIFNFSTDKTIDRESLFLLTRKVAA